MSDEPRIEEFEDVPWSHFIDQARRTPRIWYGAAAVLGVVALVFAVGRLTGRDTPAPLELTASTTPQVPPSSQVAAELPSPAAEPETPTVVVTEADLAALAPTEPAQEAVTARAEWFVRDFFTVDLDPAGSTSIRAALPTQLALPDLPQDAADTGGVSYVEWAHAYSVQQSSPGLFEVTVAFGMLTAPPEGRFTRSPPRAVVVHVALSEALGTVVVDLPQPVDLPPSPNLVVAPAAPGAAPAVVVESALSILEGWGTEAQIVGAETVGGIWRVTATVADVVGNRWPVVLWMDQNGRPTTPPVDVIG